MAKRNNSLGRRSYGGKPYDANNSFVKKMATKVTDLIPQRSWISKWFNAPQDNGDASNEDENLADGDEETHQPPAKRPRIRMDITHPPGTFSIKPRDKDSAKNHDPEMADEAEEYLLEPVVAGPSGACKFVSSTPAVHTDARNSNSQRGPSLSHIQTGNNGASNGTDDNSESGESTSGCSSLIPQTNRQDGASNSNYGASLAGGRKRFIDDKSSFANNLQSPRCLFLATGGRDSSASRRPSFNASIMNNDGNNVDRSSSLSSPFYSGNVTFGGANALGSYKRSRSLFNSTNEYQLKIPRRTRVEVKPSNGESVDASGMSQTAKRILEAMEYFSSPISDAKKIPMKKMSETSGGTKRSREERSLSSFPTTRVGLRHLTRELAVPTVPEMLKLRRRQKLQDTTVAARKIISAMSGPAPASTCPSTTITTAPTAAITGTLSSEDYHLRTETDETPKYHGKLRGTSKKNPDEEGPAPSVNLPNITLAITSLPNFEPLPKYTKPAMSSKKNDGKITVDHRHGYKFASPINITEASWNLKSINNFSFSKPINAGDSTESRIDSNIAIKDADSKASMNHFHDTPETNFMWSGSSTAPRLKVKTKQNDANFDEIEKNVNVKSAAVKELTKLKTVSTEIDWRTSRATTNDRPSNREIWECSECYIKNDSSEKKCVACKTPKVHSAGNNEFSKLSSQTANDNGTTGNSQNSKRISADNGFGSQFKLSVSQWECESCLVRNQMTNIKCVSCSSPKPAGTMKQIDNCPSIASKPPTRYDLAEKFKPAEGSWECPGCMLRNPGSFITCPCCSATKPNLTKGSAKETSPDESAAKESSKKSTAKDTGVENTMIMEKFKPAASTWECSSCLVRNAETANTCVCCSNPKPGVAPSSEKDSAPLANVQSNWGDQFKKPEGSWSCDSCMLQNKSEANECVACNAVKPGAAPKSQTAKSQFSFGVPADNQSFKFGIDKAEIKTKWSPRSKVTNGFDFGAKTAQSNVEPGQFTFGIPKQPETSDTSAKASTISSGGFVFASPKSPKDNNTKIETNKNNEISTGSNESSSDEKKPPAPFQFGIPKATNKRPESIVEESKKDETDVVAKSNSDKAPFVFGVQKKSDENSANDNESRFEVQTSEKPSIFGKPSQTTANNESKNITVTQSETPATLSVTSPSTNISAPARTPFTFSEIKPKIPSSQAPTMAPNFGQTSIPSSTSSFSITGSAANLVANSDSTENANKPVASNFGIHNSVTPSTGFGVQNSSPSTVQADASAADVKLCFTPAEKSKSTFFGVSNDNKTPVFGGAMSNYMFGNPDNKLPSAFGSNDKQVTNNTMFNSVPASSTFGVNTSGTTQSVFGNSNAPVFGGNTTTPSFGSGGNVGTSNIFASAGKTNVNPASASNQGLFTFGGTNTQQITANQTNSGTFSFGADNGDSTSSARKTIFSFGNAGNNSQPNSGECFGNSGTNTGTFGAPASTVTNPSSSPFTFNAPSPKQDPPPAFGQTTATIGNIFGTQGLASGMGQQTPAPPAFAANPTTSSTGFSFGATPSSTISGGFNFSGGMTQPAATPSGGFNFNAPSPSPTIAFDPNTRPSFNFTGGTAPTAFNATPQPVAARRIKKAVRRMQQR